jgi:glycosyltransferase involved in cell wall biosynthesis
MKIVVAHNFYQQPGGEDAVYAAEATLLERYGHTVIRYEVHNDAITGMSPPALAAAALWNWRSYAKLRALIRDHDADLVHFHNIFPLISPAAYYAARAEGAVIVQTLHNYRLACPGGNLYRNEEPCEKCLDRALPWASLRHRCYRGSAVATTGVFAMIALHRGLRTWQELPDVFVALSHFAKSKLVEAGLPESRIMIKPNVVEPDPGAGGGTGHYALYVGRLSAEKGITVLLDAWERYAPGMPLKIVGDGPLAPRVREVVERRPDIEWLGRRPRAEVYELIGEAAVVVVPSTCYETFSLVIAEAYAKGTPVVASRAGAMGEIVRPGRTGLLAESGNSADFAERIASLAADPKTLAAMRRSARTEYETQFTGSRNHDHLMAIYARALQRVRAPETMPFVARRSSPTPARPDISAAIEPPQRGA